MARKTGSQRRKARATRTEDNKKKRATKIQKEIDRIKSGGKTYWKSKEDSLTSLKNKLKVSGTKTAKKRSTIKGTPGSSKGAMAAKAMAKKRIAAGKSTLGDYGSGEDRGKLAAQAAAKRRIAAKKAAEKKNKKK